MNPQKTENILRELRGFNQDIICLQEVFEDSLKRNIINDLRSEYPYYLVGNARKRYWIGEDCGLLVLSKYKIKYTKEIILGESVFPDAMANKSILYFSIGCYNFVTTHLQSSDMNEAEDIATRQLKLLMNESPFRRYIITGDLNHSEAYVHVGSNKNNDESTCGHNIFDYIIPINLPNLIMNIRVSDIDIVNISDHNPILADIN